MWLKTVQLGLIIQWCSIVRIAALVQKFSHCWSTAMNFQLDKKHAAVLDCTCVTNLILMLGWREEPAGRGAACLLCQQSAPGYCASCMHLCCYDIACLQSVQSTALSVPCFKKALAFLIYKDKVCQLSLALMLELLECTHPRHLKIYSAPIVFIDEGWQIVS